MASGNFEACHKHTAKWEGGWSNHKADPGGKTMYGVTERVYHAWLAEQSLPFRPVRMIRMDEAMRLYKSEFWHPAGCERLNAGVDLCTYDTAVNSGPPRAKKFLKASVGGTDIQTIKKYCGKRLSFVRGLGTFKTFGKGWSRRIAGIEAAAVAMNLAWFNATDAQVRDRLAIEGGIAAEEAKANEKGAAKAGGAGGAVAGPVGGAEAMGDANQWLVYGAVAVAVVALVVVVVMLHRRKANRARAAAYAEEAKQFAPPLSGKPLAGAPEFKGDAA